MRRTITLPFTKEVIQEIRIWDQLLLNGKILVGRDQVHRRIDSLVLKGERLPVNLDGSVLYYMGPARTREGDVIGSCGPTTSARMDPFTPQILSLGVSALIGKGPRNDQVINSVAEHGALYLSAFGGCGALYADRVISTKVLAFDDLGPEALQELEVVDFPVIVAIDSLGNTIF